MTAVAVAYYEAVASVTSGVAMTAPGRRANTAAAQQLPTKGIVFGRRPAPTSPPPPKRAAPRAFDRADTLRTGRNYLRYGDPCRVGGERGVFRFIAVVTNTATGSVWAEVVGPAANPRTRSFRTDRLRRVRRDTPTR